MAPASDAPAAAGSRCPTRRRRRRRSRPSPPPLLLDMVAVYWRGGCTGVLVAGVVFQCEQNRGPRVNANGGERQVLGGRGRATRMRTRYGNPTQDVPRVRLCRPAQKIRRTKLRRERNRNPCFVVSSPALWSGRMNGCIGDAANVGPVDGTEIAGSGKQEESKQNKCRSSPAVENEPTVPKL